MLVVRTLMIANGAVLALFGALYLAFGSRPTGWIVGGVLGATLLALVAGTLPAQRAARLPARQAMGDR